MLSNFNEFDPKNNDLVCTITLYLQAIDVLVVKSHLIARYNSKHLPNGLTSFTKLTRMLNPELAYPTYRLVSLR